MVRAICLSLECDVRTLERVTDDKRLAYSTLCYSNHDSLRNIHRYVRTHVRRLFPFSEVCMCLLQCRQEVLSALNVDIWASMHKNTRKTPSREGKRTAPAMAEASTDSKRQRVQRWVSGTSEHSGNTGGDVAGGNAGHDFRTPVPVAGTSEQSGNTGGDVAGGNAGHDFRTPVAVAGKADTAPASQGPDCATMSSVDSTTTAKPGTSTAALVGSAPQKTSRRRLFVPEPIEASDYDGHRLVIDETDQSGLGSNGRPQVVLGILLLKYSIFNHQL